MSTTNEPNIEDTSSDQIDDVRKYMEEQGIAIPVSEDENAEAATPSEDAIAPADEETAEHDNLLDESDEEDDYDPDEEQEVRKNQIQLAIDRAYAEDALEQMTNLYQTHVKGFEYKISEEEKEAYLRCMLNDTPVILTITTLGTNVPVTCRGLSVYEIELATYAGIQFVKEREEQREMAELMWRSEVQKYRLAMQMMKFSDTMYDYLEFKPEPGKLEEHCTKLRRIAAERFGNMNVIRWKMCIHALNIFEHKLTRLNELALMPDFISPGGLD